MKPISEKQLTKQKLTLPVLAESINLGLCKFRL